jgi:hypothetical protein
VLIAIAVFALVSVMAGLVPAIHVFFPYLLQSKTWMPGTRLVLGPAGGRTRVPGMTVRGEATNN